MGFYPFGGAGPLQLQAATPLAGTQLVNGTPVILTWNVPNDGKLHWHLVFGGLTVQSAETGGQVTETYTLPDGTVASPTLFSPGAGLGYQYMYTSFGVLIPVRPGSQVLVSQASALTAGAATLWAGIWGA